MTQPPKLPIKQVFMAGLVLVALACALVTPPGLTPIQGRILGAVLVTLGFWATGVVPNYLASLILISVALIFGLAPSDQVFAGFGAAAVWLIVSGFVIGSAISTSGLGARLAGALGPHLGGSYAGLIAGLTGVAMLLGFIMPSSVGRAVVMVPIGMALADRAGFGPGTRGRSGIAVALTLACNVPSFAILTANIPNMVLTGAAETIGHVRLGYTEYLTLHYPILGLVKSALTVWLILRLFPAKVASPVQMAPVATSAPNGAEVRVMVILLTTLGFWMTDRLHGINPAWVGIAAATVLLSPRLGVVSPAAFKASVDFGLLLFVVGALALGTLVNASGLGALLGHLLESVLPLQPGRDFVNFVSLSLMGLVTGLFTTAPSVPSVLTPLAQDLAGLTGFSLPAVLMTQVIGFSTVLFPYQIAPLVVAMQLSGEKLSHLLRITLPLAAITILGLLPLDYLWWKLLGWI
jgi:di/tricarboxylate transporter